MWFSTVHSEIESSKAICRLVSPRATRMATSCSRGRVFQPVRQPVVTAARVRGLAWEQPAPLLRRGQFADRLLAHRA